MSTSSLLSILKRTSLNVPFGPSEPNHFSGTISVDPPSGGKLKNLFERLAGVT